MNTTALTKIQRQSIHECIIESDQQASAISKDDYGCRSICEIQNNALQASHGFFRINYFVAIEKSRTQDQNRI